MTELFQQVMHHLEGEEVVINNYQTKDGAKTLTRKTVGVERWIEGVQNRGILRAIDCITLIYFALDDFDLGLKLEQRIRIVESWSLQLREAAVSGEVKARDGITLLPLENVPEGLDWVLSIIDAQNFLDFRGMTWKLSEVSAHIYGEVKENINKFHFPPELFSSDNSSAPETPKPIENVVIDTPKGITKNQALTAFEEIAKPCDLKRLLSDKPKWIKDACIDSGKQGVREGTWNPLLLAIALRDEKKIPKSKLTNAFSVHKFLSHWREDWFENSDY